MWFGSSGWVATADNTASRLVGLLVFLPFLFAGGPCSAGSGLDSAATSPAFAGFGLALLACSETFATSWAASSSVLALVRVSGAADAACAAFLSPRLGLSLAGGPFLVEALPASPGAGPGAGCVAPASGRASAAGRVGDAAFATGSSRSSPALAEAAREAFLAPAAGLGACAAAPAPFLVDFANGTAPLTAPPRAPGCGPGPVPSTLASNSAEALGSCCRSSFPRGSSPEFFLFLSPSSASPTGGTRLCESASSSITESPCSSTSATASFCCLGVSGLSLCVAASCAPSFPVAACLPGCGLGEELDARSSASRRFCAPPPRYPSWPGCGGKGFLSAWPPGLVFGVSDFWSGWVASLSALSFVSATVAGLSSWC
mmetsp:Transcript_17450/g.33349  ORF Transcript_17450/g.33349 Transcript_17450/m.33349 type:complete len:373 (-) Transcript_17450:942-2060(-)